MVKRKKKIRIPKAWIRIDKKSHTIGTRNPRTGKMTGRKFVRGVGDRTKVRRVIKGEHSGEIFGRTPSVIVKGSKSRRGTSRKRPIRRRL